MSISRSPNPSRRILRMTSLIASGSIVLAAAIGCTTSSSGGSSADSGGDLSAAQQQCVDKANNYLETRGLLPGALPPELTPLSKAPTKGLTFTYVFAGSVPTAANAAQKMVDAAPVLGWTGKKLAFDGSVEDANRKVLDAVSNSDIVTIAGIPEAALQAPIAAAKDRGVLLMIDSAEPPQSVPGWGATPLGGDFWTKVGEPAAYASLQATNCEGSTAVFGLPVPAMRQLGEGIEAVIKRECAECGVSYTDLAFSDIGAPSAANAVTSKLQADPSIKLAFFAVGDLANGLEPALKQAGIDVKIGGALASTPNLAALKQDRNSFWLGFPPDMTAWITLDTAARALDSGQPTVGNHYPVPIFTKDNVDSTDEVLPYPSDYQAQFEELWKVSP